VKDLKPVPWLRWSVWTGLLGLFLSGLLLALPAWSGERAQGPAWDFLRSRASALHGALAMAFLVLLGALTSHVSAGLKAKRNLVWGLALLGVLGLVIATAWGLYYLPEDAKPWIVQVHLWGGILLPLLVLLHAAKGRGRPRA
jgi:hypothetical protein